MVNSGVFQSLTQSLSRELDCARQIEKQMESLQEIESLQELRTAQSRLAALERTHQSALEAREDGHVMVTKMVEDACGDRVAALGREVAASRLQLQSALALVAQRERFADEKVEAERRLFVEALKRQQADMMNELRHVHQMNVERATKAPQLLEKVASLRETLSRRSVLAWQRGLVAAVLRHWRGEVLRSSRRRLEAAHTQQLRAKVDALLSGERAAHVRHSPPAAALRGRVRVHVNGAAQLVQVQELTDTVSKLQRRLETIAQEQAMMHRRDDRRTAKRCDDLERQLAAMTEAADRHRREAEAAARGQAEALDAISALSSSVARAELVGRSRVARTQELAELENAALAEQVDALAFELQGSKIVEQLSAVEEKARADDRDDLRRLALTAEARAKRAEHEGAVECARLHARLHEVDAQREVAEERLRVAAEAQRREAADAAEAIAEERTAAARRAAALEEQVRIAQVASEISVSQVEVEVGLALRREELQRGAAKAEWGSRFREQWSRAHLAILLQAWCRFTAEAALRRHRRAAGEDAPVPRRRRHSSVACGGGVAASANAPTAAAAETWHRPYGGDEAGTQLKASLAGLLGVSPAGEEDEAVAGAQLHDLTEAEPTLTEAAAGGSVSPDTYGDDTARTVAETDPWRLIGELKAMLL